VAWWRNKRSADAPGDRDRAWKRALRAAVGDDWATVETWLERIVEADTDDLDAYHALAKLYRRQGDVGRALRMHQNLLLRADLARDQRVEAQIELARDFEAGGYKERAAATYEEILAAQPRNLEVVERLVPLLQDLREYPRALALVRRLRRPDRAKAERQEVEILLAQAQGRIDEGDLDGARQAIKRCLRRDKACGRAWAILGEIEAERGKNAKALAAWKRAAQVDVDVAAALYPKIDASFAERRKPEEFDAFLKEILEERPTDHAARIALARALASRGNARAAIEELARSVEVVPDHLGLRVELGHQLLASGQDAESLKAYAELLGVLDHPALPLGENEEEKIA
jgi:lipopolysaccharide biosynthesis regulator YciM